MHFSCCKKSQIRELCPDLYISSLIIDWDQLVALDITQKSSLLFLLNFVIFVSVSKLFENIIRKVI